MKELKDICLISGKMLKLEVVVSGTPKPDVHWLQDDQRINESDFLLETKDKTHSLTISESNLKHAGTYTAVAENNAGEAISTCQVGIQTKPLIQKPADVKIISGSEFCVEISVEGTPDPDVKILKDKVELSPSLGINIDRKEKVYILSLKASNTSLNGNYTINATNPAGKDSANFKVSVLGELDTIFLSYLTRTEASSIRKNRIIQ